jgi:hypothetical protein
MFRLHSVLLSSALLLAPISVTAAFAQSGNATATTSAPAAVVPPSTNGAGNSGTVRQVSPDSPSAQTQNPPGAQPGTGSGMGKVSGTAAGN